jgi:cell shape-determining protein MreC
LADYDRLTAQIGSPSFAGFKAIPTAVVGRPLDTFHSEFILSRGAKDGIVLGAPLVINGSTIIGFVTELHHDSSVGRLLLHPSTTLAAEVEGDNEQRIQGLVVGDRYTAIRFTTVPRDLELKKDQAVVTTAKPNELPGGLLIGTITVINNQQNAAYQEAQLKLPYNPDQLSAVAVLVLP